MLNRIQATNAGPRVLNEQVMDEVKNSMANNASDNQPKISSEAQYGEE